MALEKYRHSASSSNLTGKTEFEILKASHRFLRDDAQEPLTWEEQLAKKFYDNLYREYAVCDLKHYKSGNFSLRWRTEDEVLSGAGETTCGNTRCPFHSAHNVEEARPSLKVLELPFSYSEDDETKFALVKVVLCDKCCKKLMWKRNKEKERSVTEKVPSQHDIRSPPIDEPRASEDHSPPELGESLDRHYRRRASNEEKVEHRHRRRRNSRSRSPLGRQRSIPARSP